MTAKSGIPRKMFKRVAEYEDALGYVKEAHIAATRDWLLSKTCPLCSGRNKPRSPTPKIALDGILNDHGKPILLSTALQKSGDITCCTLSGRVQNFDCPSIGCLRR